MKKLFSLFLLLSFPLSIFALGDTHIPAQVIEILDGDTIRVSMSGTIDTVRVLGIDTPEKYITRTGKKECYGEEASEYAVSTLSGKIIELESDSRQKGRDIYDRKLAHVWIDGELYGENAIELGYAFQYIAKSTKYQKTFINAEKVAKQSKLGLWSVCGGKRIPVTNIGSTTQVTKVPNKIVKLPKSVTSIPLNTSTGSEILSCSVVKNYCYQIKTREEAQFYLTQCGKNQIDRDSDGIACENCYNCSN